MHENIIQALQSENSDLKLKLKDSFGIIKELRATIRKLEAELTKYDTKQPVSVKFEESFNSSSDDQPAYPAKQRHNASGWQQLTISKRVGLSHSERILIVNPIQTKQESPHERAKGKPYRDAIVNNDYGNGNNHIKSKGNIITSSTFIGREEETPKMVKNQSALIQKDKRESPKSKLTLCSVRSDCGDSIRESFQLDKTEMRASRKGGLMPFSQQLFKKSTNMKQMFSCFFVTGMTENGTARVIYSYPRKSTHFDAILALCYGQTSIQAVDSSLDKTHIKDMFVIPLRKQTGEGMEYLVACETEGVCKLGVFARLYCFITPCRLIKELGDLVAKLLEKMGPGLRKCTTEQAITELLQEQVETPLAFLHPKSVDETKSVDFLIGEGLKVEIYVSPLINIVDKYKPWKILNMEVHFRMNENEALAPPTPAPLFGILLIYILAEVKIVLYSSFKSKISEALLHALQIIKPFEYVSPIIMAILTREHEEYINSPVSLILGLWSEQVRQNKRKLQIFITKKTDSLSLIDRGLLPIPDGILINLDSGLIFGGGADSNLTQVGLRLNRFASKYCKQSADVYQLFDRMVNDKSDSTHLRELWKAVESVIMKTQHYCYYKEQRQSK